MNSFLPLHKFERGDIVLFQNRYASELKIEMRELNDIQTFVYQLEGSNFEQFPFFNWTHGKSSCITCNKEIRQKSLDCTYARNIKRSKRPIILLPWI